MNINRNEYPRPQMVRDYFECLNGIWDFTIDSGESLKERGLFKKESFDKTIMVPFCPESNLSGIACKDFMNAVCYHREFMVADARGEKIILHFGACDYYTEVYVNKKLAGTHYGGYSSFSFEIQDYVDKGTNNHLTVYVKDDNRYGEQPRGKQCPSYYSKVCDYTRTTGIWQTVWLEYVEDVYIKNIHFTPDVSNQIIKIEAVLNTWFEGEADFNITFEGKKVCSSSVKVKARHLFTNIMLNELHLWDIGSPNLYDIQITLRQQQTVKDQIASYFGMREITFQEGAFLLNGRKTFMRLILDQGFYPEGIYTAPSDEDLKNDILLAQAAGYNGGRLHQKIFEERFLYHCDKLGYIVFGEYPDAGLAKDNDLDMQRMLNEWMEAIQRDYSHPSIIGWAPLNESSIERNPRFSNDIYQITRALDKTRPVIDASGFTHVITDIYDVHDYEQDIELFKSHMEKLETGMPWQNFPDQEKDSYTGQPYFVSEYGGIWWSGETTSDSWGYGDRPQSIEEFYERFEKLTAVLLNNPKVCGFCYTQLTDVEQEKNGIYNYDRSRKFDLNRIRAINSAKAAIEE